MSRLSLDDLFSRMVEDTPANREALPVALAPEIPAFMNRTAAILILTAMGLTIAASVLTTMLPDLWWVVNCLGLLGWWWLRQDTNGFTRANYRQLRAMGVLGYLAEVDRVSAFTLFGLGLGALLAAIALPFLILMILIRR